MRNALEEDKKLLPQNCSVSLSCVFKLPMEGVLGCLRECVLELPHPFAAQCLHPLLPAKLQVFLVALVS